MGDRHAAAARAREVYSIDRWSGGYFEIDDEGRLRARIPGRAPAVDLAALAADVAGAGYGLPVLIRFSDILHHRVDALCGAFESAVRSLDYGGRYTAVYPIKVNQQRQVVQEILRHGGPRVGLEAGSKPELLAVMALSRAGGTIVCNGYKDPEYVRLALIGSRIGLRVYLVIEKPSELPLVLAEARRMGVRPRLGLRVRLAAMGTGKWQNTGGERSKFGLSASQVLEVVETLSARGALGSLELLHCHLGSQMANVRDIQRGLQEAARYYAELRALGAPLSTVDVGGGLGVDYEGTASRNECSMNYTMREYANNVVQALHDVCAQCGLPHPDLITESGRALTAHHAVLITNAIDRDGPPQDPDSGTGGGETPLVISHLRGVLERVAPGACVEAYHDAAYWLAEAQGLYLHGVLDLRARALAERLYFAVCRRVRAHLNPAARAHRELVDELNDKLAEKWFLNLSIFQSLPDVWAIDQIFPIVPLQRLNEPATSRALIQDLTCDSDGCIALYVNGDGVEKTLPLPPLEPGSPYLLGIFLAGAYQETLGDVHNLFGDTNTVNVELDEDGYRLLDPERGDTVSDLLRYVHFEPEALLAAMRVKVEASGLDEAACAECLSRLEAGLGGYTYLED